MFEDRIDKSQILHNMFKLWCSVNRIPYLETGIEHKQAFNSFRQLMYRDKGSFAKAIRYQPDFMVYNHGQIWYIELKNSMFIERDAYNEYKKLFQDGIPVGIIILYESIMQLIKIEDLVLKLPYSACPVDGIWRVPRDLDKISYLKWKQKTKGSGTVFSCIDLGLSKRTNLSNHNITFDSNPQLHEQLELL